MYRYKRVVLASSNPGKIRELRALLQEAVAEILPQDELGITGAEETGYSFVENALLKARHASRQSGLPALADDSGLVVDALHGAPGIYSARYAGPSATDLENNQKLVQALCTIAAPRTAYYVAVIVLVRHAMDPVPLIAEAHWHGEIILEAQGSNGFGYDPHFWIPECAVTAAQLEPRVKNALSHRGKALQSLLQLMQGLHPC